MEFHPGGELELMRGAGTDATPLFTEIHPWVNYESMLKSCLVGQFVGNRSKRSFISFSFLLFSYDHCF
jgi:cytochrome-b5 reductase